jgi:hypothetical protein
MRKVGRTLLLFFITSLINIFQVAAIDRNLNIDAIVLIDKSLSMASTIGEVKRYAAGRVIEALLMPGDRLVVEQFYGKTERLFAGTIRNEADKAAVIRSLNSIVADGPFTDIGAALDRAAADLVELASPERPKLILLLTDERQEAPAGSKYVAKNFVLSHPALRYVKRVDLGSFRAITVGFGVAERVDQTAPQVMRLLEEVPARDDRDYPPLPKDTEGGLSGAATLSGGATGMEAAPAARNPAAQAARGSLPVLTLAILVAVLIVVVLAGLLVSTLVLKRKKRRDEERNDP